MCWLIDKAWWVHIMPKCHRQRHQTVDEGIDNGRVKQPHRPQLPLWAADGASIMKNHIEGMDKIAEQMSLGPGSILYFAAGNEVRQAGRAS